MCFAIMGGILVIALALQLIVLRPKYDDKDQEFEAVSPEGEEAETITA